MRAWLPLLLLPLLVGCPTRELYLREAEAPWIAEGLATVVIPTFEAPPAAWAVADRARRELAEALGRGTARVVAAEAAATLRGAVTAFEEGASPGAPRRVLRTSGSTGPLPPGPFNEDYAWEADVAYHVRLALVVRLLKPDGVVVWTKEAFGTADESQAVRVNWPGNDPVPPPANQAYPADPALMQRLRERALAQALDPLATALTIRYNYRDVK